jgi:hypothetical protein
MIEQELIKIWQSSPNQERIKFEKSRLIIEMQSSIDRLHRGLKYRDLREQIGAAVAIPVFACYVYSIPFVLSKIASVLIIFWCVFAILRIRNAKKQKPGAFTETYLEYLRKSKEYIIVQKQLLDSVLYWYILPCWAMLSLFLAGFIGVSGKLRWLIQTEVFSVLFSVAIYFLNKQSVKKQFIPRLQKIDELIATMEKE